MNSIKIKISKTALLWLIFCLTAAVPLYAQELPSCCEEGIVSRGSLLQTQAVQPSQRIAKDAAKMILLQGGTFEMGSPHFADATIHRTIVLSPYWIDEHEVTNAQFALFVEETGYITVAERPLNPKDYPDVDPTLLVPGSAVFQAPVSKSNLRNHLSWWQYVEGASWKHPEGPLSTIAGREQHPVVHVAYEDAAAYATWASKRLPTEAEWEYAAKGGTHTDETYYWGNELKKEGVWQANIFQGRFPQENTAEDGYATTAPVKSFPANAYGLYDLSGNVWEWCADLYQPHYQLSDTNNPKGPATSHDPQEPGAIKKVLRGGSFLCSDAYCERYKAGARGKGEINSTSNHIGFRCAQDYIPK